MIIGWGNGHDIRIACTSVIFIRLATLNDTTDMIQSIDHINLVVDDLDAMTRFYERLLGLKVTKRVTVAGEWIDDTVGLKNVKADVVYLDAPSGPRVELIRYHSPSAPP